jgi:cobalt-precorrin 5A hydrolase/precorrin-3B C17-methyltransferase
MSERLSWGFALNSQALPLLRQLLERGLIDRIASPADGEAWQPRDLQRLLESEWPRSRAFVAIGACGAITRLIAPLLLGKERDPAVVVADSQGRYAIPLLGGHGAGAEALAQSVAALLGGEAALTGSSASQQHVALDAFGQRWGWRRGSGDWNALMKAAARGNAVVLDHQSGNPRWLQLPGLPPQRSAGMPLSVGVERSAHCRWHPLPCGWVWAASGAPASRCCSAAWSRASPLRGWRWKPSPGSRVPIAKPMNPPCCNWLSSTAGPCAASAAPP